ncbi:MAG: 50S ribosomal protein L25/general stress protein Ctc [Chlamydiota bacterium]|jgi:large subunit ribosomal protein L25
MKLSVFKREGNAKSVIKKLRRQGDIPAIIYGPKVDSEKVFLKGPEFEALLRKLEAGSLGSTLFSLSLENKEHKAVVKDIHYDITSYKPIHVDFEITSEDLPVNVSVPIELVGKEECQGVKLGGVLRPVIRFIKVRCLPKDIPSKFSLDVKNLVIGQSLKLSDIDIPENVRPLARMNEVAVAVAKR